MTGLNIDHRLRTVRHRAALDYARQGIPVFPCLPGSKAPAYVGSFHGSSTDIAAIEKWWGEADYNLAISPEDAGWCVIDLDGGVGQGSWFDLTNQFGEIETYTVATPSGGRHLYFKGSLPSSVQKLGAKIDTRGRGGYVLVPPSTIEGRDYRVMVDVDPAPLPAWIPERMASLERERVKAPEGVDLDSPDNLDRARSRLRQLVARGDVAVESQGGNDRTYRLAAEIVNLGLSPEGALDLIDAEWNGHCVPPWDRDELEALIGNAARYAQNEAGAWAIGPIPEAWQVIAAANPPVEAPSGPWPTIKSATQLSGMVFEPPRWVWQDRVLAFEPNLLTGDAGVGKTTMCENVAVAVAAGAPCLGHETMKQPVLMLVAEDNYGPVRDNLVAIRGALQVPEETLDDVHVLSVKSDKIAGGHRLVTIGDDGRVDDTPFMREFLAPWLAAIEGPVLLVVDPISEFARWDRYKDDACRALATTWLDAVTRIGAGRVTPLVTDHPSKASMASGEHYAGSVQMKAAFSLFATLQGKEWSGTLRRQRDMVYKVIKGRYAGEEETRFVRTNHSPAFVVQNGPGHAPDDDQVRVFQLVTERMRADEKTSRTNNGFGPGEVAFTLAIEEKAARVALTALTARKWLIWEPGGYIIGPKAPDEAALNGY